MTDFVLATPSQKQVWSDKIVREYVRESTFLPYMSSNGDGIINVQNELMGSAGNLIHVPLIAKLRGTGVRGSATLVGNEDVMANYSMGIQTDVVRNAVNVKISDAFKTEMDLHNAAQADLKGWLGETLRTDLITELRSVPVPGTSGTNPEDSTLPFATANATAATMNAYVTANSDRIMFGAKSSNLVAGNFASSLSNIGTTATTSTDRLSARFVQLARAKARQTTLSSPFAIKPYKTKSGQEWYVLFVDTNGFIDLQNDPVILAANQNARPRESDINDNPLFSGDYLTYSGVIVKEVPELTTIATNIGYASLCGLQAVNLGYSMKAKPTRRAEDDYGMNAGVGVMEIRGQRKASVLGTQVGMLSIFHGSFSA